MASTGQGSSRQARTSGEQSQWLSLVAPAESKTAYQRRPMHAPAWLRGDAMTSAFSLSHLGRLARITLQCRPLRGPWEPLIPGDDVDLRPLIGSWCPE
jgi:hypothetical protein